MYSKQINLMVLLVGCLVGIGACSLVPDKPVPIIFPSTFDELKPIEQEVVLPTELPELQKGVCLPTKEECSFIGFDSSAFEVLQRYRIIAEGNTEIAVAMGNATRNTVDGYNSLILAGQRQEDITKIREEQLIIERKENSYTVLWYRILIIGIAALGFTAGT